MVKVMKKRVIAVLLAIFTIATLICVPAVADEGAEPENPKLTLSFDWYTKNPDANTFYISSAEEFLGLCELTWDETHRTVKKLGIDPVDFEGKTVELTADINLNPGWEWSVKIDEKGKVTCVDAPANVCHGMDAFHGTLDGCGHTVSGLYFNRALGSWGHVGFIYQVKKFCNIKNIAFTNGVIYTDTAKVTTGSGGKGMGALIGAVNDVGATCKIENLYFGLDVLHVRRSDYKGGGTSMVGGLIGRIEKAKTPDNANGYYPVEIDSTAVAGKIIAVNENMTSINTKVQTSQFVACGNNTGGNCAIIRNCVAMGTIVLPCVEKYGENKKSKFVNYIEGALGKDTEIKESIFKTDSGNILIIQNDMDVADFTYSDIAKAIVPTSVAEILDPVFVQNNTYAQIKVGDVENTTDIRFVSAFKGNPGDYSEVGYYISLSVPNPHKADSYPLVSSTLYKSVLAAGAPKVAPEGCLWLALGINGIPAANADTPIYIRPYAVKADGTVVLGKVMTVTVNEIQVN